ncbi:MAG: 1-deoxy-D-xylulose-5-phosphate synthase [Clostridiales bacterium]|nr:1-deoxy-D-xylulose-5-phosphate synthase [Clostridiales bacterium]
MLNKINKSEDIKKLNNKEKGILAKEIRELILDVVSKNGGHLASNLGVVELTIALHSVFNFPQDKIVWDVGHQSYVHKILTGRKDRIYTIRKINGLSGFPKTNESEYDVFNTGHSSTSISASLGIARANKLMGNLNHTIAVIGDGALTGGMALEALNDAGNSNANITVILNDNEMSISKNIGGMNNLLNLLRTRKLYTKSNYVIKNLLSKIPIIGPRLVVFFRRVKRMFKQLLLNTMYFEDIGFTYLGPVDGHDIKKLENILKESKNISGPVLIHVKTVKGKGYEFAEKYPDKFHSISPFNIETGEKKQNWGKDYSKVFGDTLTHLADKNEKIVAITASMCQGTGLYEFSKKYPERFFDIGIAEQHALTLASGMASQGYIPVVPIYSSFLQRGFDQVIHDICMNNIPVIIGIDRAGLVGNDGETHQGIFDLSFLNLIPNLNILSPKNFKELELMLEFATKLNKPIAIRYPRGKEKSLFNKNDEIELGKAEIIQEGKDVCIFAIGKMVEKAYEVAQILNKENIQTEVINMRFLKPIDEDIILKNKDKLLVTIEDNTLKGGLYTEVINVLNKNNILKKVYGFGYNDKFIEHGTIDELEKKYGLDSENISRTIKKWILN